MITLAYHLVDQAFYAGITRVTPLAFARQINYLEANGFVTRLPSEPSPSAGQLRKVVCITFDDAYECVFTHAFPILAERGFRASVYVVVDYIGKSNAWDVRLSRPIRHMSWTQILELAEAGWDIGSHSLSHPDLCSVGHSRLLAEVVESKARLEERLGRAVRTFSYPFGAFSERVVEVVRQAGYQAAYGMYIPTRLRAPRLQPFNRARRGVYLLDTLGVFASKVKEDSGALLMIMERLVNFCSRGTVLVKGPKIA